jgi:serine/threonine-protein kinase
MGVLYVGRHLQTGRRAAVKVIDQATPDALARFKLEARVSAQLNHPGIVDVFDADMDAESGSCFIAMELLEGFTMRQVMDDPDSTPQRVLELLIAALEPLAVAHEHGFVHRDLKPENLFVLAEPGAGTKVKLLDFGIVSQQTDERLTRAGTAMGTPHYMSPEQATSAREAGPASDIWSMGVMMYEAIRGEVPFQGETGHGIIVQACTCPHMPLVATVPGVDPEISSLIDRCLAKSPAERPQHARALASAWRGLLHANSLPAARPSMAGHRAPVQRFQSTDTDSGVRPSLRTRSVANAANMLAASGVVCSLSALALPFTGVVAPGAALLCAAIGGGLLLGASSRARTLRELLKPVEPVAQPKQRATIVQSRRPKRLIHPARGSDTASVRIELYGDITCAITRRAYQRVMALRNDHPDDIAVIWKPYWDPQRESAPFAAEVARALFEREGQQTFWAFFDRMLLTTRKITSDVLLSAAADVGADMHGFRRALRTRVHKNSLYSCREEAEALGIDTSPTLVINDVMLVGEPSEDRLHWAYVDAKSALESRRRVEMGATHAGIDLSATPLVARALLIRYRGARNAPSALQRTREQARERASKLISRARMEGADFTDVALRFADALLEPNEIMPRLIDPVLADALTSIKPGELTAPVECDEGFLVAQRVA